MEEGRGSGDVPAELRDALDRYPDAQDLWGELSPSHRREYCEFVSEAKKATTRVRRADKTVELMRQRRARKAELKARGPAPVTTAIDEALASVIAPDLKEMGFKKQRRNWRQMDERGARVVSTQAGRHNETNSGWFSVALGVGWEADGSSSASWRAELAGNYLRYIGRSRRHHFNGHFHIAVADDPAQRQELTSRFAAAWEAPLGRELVRRAADPAVLCEHLIQHGELSDLLRAVTLGDLVGSAELQTRAIGRAFQQLREDPELRRPDMLSPSVPSDIWLSWAVKDIEFLLERADRLGVAVDAADRAMVGEIVHASLTVMDNDGGEVPSQTALDLIREAPALRAVAERLGINAVPTIDRAIARRDLLQPWRPKPNFVEDL